MTTANSTRSLIEDLNEGEHPLFVMQAMLQGAEKLIEDPGAYSDPNGEVWAARELIDAVLPKFTEVHEGLYKLRLRLEALDRGEVSERVRRTG